MSRAYLQDYVFVLGTSWRRLPFILGLMVLSTGLDLLGLGLVVPLISVLMNPSALASTGSGIGFDLTFGGGGALPIFATLGGALFLAFVAKGLVAYKVQHTIISFSENHRCEVMVRLMRSYLSQPHEFHLQRNSATLVNAVIQATYYYSGGTLGNSMKALGDALMLAAILTLLALTDAVAVAMLFALGALVFVVYNRVFKRRSAESGKQVLSSNAGVVSAVNQGVGSYKESKVLGVESYFPGVVSREGARLARALADMSAISAVPRYMVEASIILFLVLYGVGSLALGRSPEQVVPVLALFAAAGLRVMPAFSSILSGLQALRFSRASLSLIANDLRSVPERGEGFPTGLERVALPADFETIELRNVTYTYPDAPTPALRSLSLVIRSGEAVGIVGRSGAGKSTLADVVLGLLRPQDGQVLVDGVDLWSDREQWFRRVAYVPQTIFILDDSLRRNVALGVLDADIDEMRVLHAIRSVQLVDLVQEMPDGLDSILGERGTRLSGGQRQRVALARAFYHNRDVIVMDEATSALDSETEQEVVVAINSLKGSKTLVIIAHGTSILAGCDWVYRIEDGRLVEKAPGSTASIVEPDVRTERAYSVGPRAI